jgi:hypothetical protein
LWRTLPTEWPDHLCFSLEKGTGAWEMSAKLLFVLLEVTRVSETIDDPYECDMIHAKWSFVYTAIAFYFRTGMQE